MVRPPSQGMSQFGPEQLTQTPGRPMPEATRVKKLHSNIVCTTGSGQVLLSWLSSEVTRHTGSIRLAESRRHGCRVRTARGFSRDFHRLKYRSSPAVHIWEFTKGARIGIRRASRNNPSIPPAPLPLHSPVNELHSIEIQALTSLLFLLT